MSIGLVVLVTACYVGVSAEQFWRGDGAMGLIFLGYSIANLGFIMGLK